MPAKLSVKEYQRNLELATPRGEICPDKQYDLYQRWGRYGYPEVSVQVTLSPDDCWILRDTRVWVFKDMTHGSYGLCPESYLQDWFLIQVS